MDYLRGTTESLFNLRDWEERWKFISDRLHAFEIRPRPHLIVYATLARLGTFIEVGSNSVRCILYFDLDLDLLWMRCRLIRERERDIRFCLEEVIDHRSIDAQCNDAAGRVDLLD